jgi:hypothetical protein
VLSKRDPLASVEKFTMLRRTPPAAALALRYPYLSNAPLSDTYYHATKIQIRGILVLMQRQEVCGVAQLTLLLMSHQTKG